MEEQTCEKVIKVKSLISNHTSGGLPAIRLIVNEREVTYLA